MVSKKKIQYPCGDEIDPSLNGDREGLILHRVMTNGDREGRIFLAHWIRLSRFYHGIENLILPMLSYPGRQEILSCEIAS